MKSALGTADLDPMTMFGILIQTGVRRKVSVTCTIWVFLLWNLLPTRARKPSASKQWEETPKGLPCFPRPRAYKPPAVCPLVGPHTLAGMRKPSAEARERVRFL